jgi:D-xylose transport system substrate-binding protein
MNYRNIFIALATISGGISASAQAAESATVAFLMPDQASTRYEQHDFPGFKAEMSKLCAECKVIYQNANASATLQQQQFNSVIAQGRRLSFSIRLTPPRPPPWSKMPRLRMLK